MNKENKVKTIMESMERAKRNYIKGIFTHAQQENVIRINVKELLEIYPANQVCKFIYAYNLSCGAAIIEDAKEIIKELTTPEVEEVEEVEEVVELQYNLFDIIDKNLQEKEQTMEKFEGTLRVFEAFAGVGSQRMALRNLNIDHEVVGVAEIDKYALKSYEAIHGDCPNYGDISKIDPHELPDMDLFTYSFPCQDLSVAGKQAGLTGGTRSGLLYECEKVIEAKRPKFLLLENVKNLVGKKFKPEFDKWLEYLEGLGYSNYWEVLNAKHYGVPQNRERVFVVSILNDKGYKFPAKQELTKRVRDILEPEVDEKFYMNKPFHLVDKGNIKAEFTNINFDQTKRIHGIDGIFQTLSGANRGIDNILVKARVEGLNEQNSRVYGVEGISGTLNTMQGGHREPKILDNYRVRKLTPLECWRLMGFTDQDFYKAQAVCSNSQLYKQAGNSIVVNVLEGIFKNLFL